jgi:hypothetical protein
MESSGVNASDSNVEARTGESGSNGSSVAICDVSVSGFESVGISESGSGLGAANASEPTLRSSGVNASDSNVDTRAGVSDATGSGIGVSVSGASLPGTFVSKVDDSAADPGRANGDVAAIILSPHWLQKTLLSAFSAKQCGHLFNVQPFPGLEPC